MNSTEQPEYSWKDLATPINDAFLKAFATGQLIIDCPRIVVRQLAADAPQVYQGRGMLSLLASEEFQLRMYVDDDGAGRYHPLNELMRMTRWVPGEVIPPDEYYELTATDLSGFEWTCAKIQVKLHGRDHGVVVTGRLFDTLRHRAPGLTGSLPSVVSMYFFDDLRVPYTQLVSTQSSVGERKLSTQLRPLLASFAAGDFKFEVQKAEHDKGSTILRITSHGNLWPEAIETRVEEALRYVTLSPVRWCIVEKRIGDTRHVAVMPRKPGYGSIFDEPLDHRRADYAADFWRLFVAYFLHVVPHPDAKNYHPLSAQLFHVISGETHQLDLMGLLVSVAVEGVLCVFRSR